MLIKLFGLLDILAALTLFLMRFGTFESLGIILGLYLIIKGLIFFSFVSLIDIIAGIFLMLGGLGNYIGFSWIFILWLIQKGFISFYG